MSLVSCPHRFYIAYDLKEATALDRLSRRFYAQDLLKTVCDDRSMPTWRLLEALL